MVDFQVIDETSLSWFNKNFENLELNHKVLSEYLLDVSLLDLELKLKYSQKMIAQACVVVSSAAL